MDTNALNELANGPAMPFGFSTATLIASLIWGSIGAGYLIYAKKQRSVPAYVGGAGLIGVSYLIGSPLWMSLAAVGVMAGIWYWSRYD